MTSYDLPIKYDCTFLCQHCNAYTLHQCTAYKDAEYRHCSRCGITTTWIPGGDGKLVLRTEKLADNDREEQDFKRNNPRKYKKRRK